MTNRESNSVLLRLQMLKDFDSDVIDRLMHDISRYTVGAYKDIASQAENIRAETLPTEVDKAWLLELLDDDRSLIDEVYKMSYELAIVALYKKIEVTTKRAVETVYTDIPSKHFFEVKKLKRHLQEKGIDIRLLPHFDAMDEVRCLSRDIKHGGVVSARLAAHSSWKKGEALEDLDVAYARLAPLCTSYLQELIEILMQKWSSITLSSPDDIFDLDDSATE